MSKIEQTNGLLLEQLATAVNQLVHLPDGLITVSYVNCSPDLKEARVGVSVLPDRLAGTALRALKSATGQLVAAIRRQVRLRQLPHFIWEFDATEREASRVERLIADLD